MTEISSTIKRPRIHVLYEYSTALRPHSSPFLRLIRPLTHPLVQEHITASFGLDYSGEPADLVIIDRLWRRDISLELVQELVSKVRRSGARLLYTLDDNYFDLAFTEGGWPSREVLPIVSYLLHSADAVLVTTPTLRDRLLEYNPNIRVLANQLDERLLVIRHPGDTPAGLGDDRIVIGYMGTFTHDEDLKMVLLAFEAIHHRHPGRIEFQLVGVVDKEETKQHLQALPVRYVYPRPEEHEYPLFMLWFTGHVQWDIAISPLQHTPFNICKSDIKFLDYASIAAAGIFSQSPVYSSSVQHLDNGWIAANTPEAWEEALEALIQDASLRRKLAANASKYLYRERTLVKHAMEWVDLIISLC